MTDTTPFFLSPGTLPSHPNKLPTLKEKSIYAEITIHLKVSRFAFSSLLSLDLNFFFSNVALAKGFDIRLGKYEVTAPSVADGNDYQIVCE